MAIVSKMTRCAACGSTAVTYSEGTKLYHCADCGAERHDSMPAADLAAVNSILALGDTEGKLDELGRLEAAEHLAYCDRCMDRYTALLTDDVLEQPPRSARGAVMGTIWIRLMQNTWGRAAVATGQQLNTWLPQTTQQTEPELLGKPVNDKAPQPSTAPLGKPIEDKKQLTEKLSDALDGLLHRSADTTEK